MDKAEWKMQITDAMRDLGTYKDTFDPVIDTLSNILERRDACLAKYEKEGSKPLVTKTLDRGAKNKAKNPLLTIIQEHEADALKYWNALGLTPSGKLKQEEDGRKGSRLLSALMENRA